MSFSMQQGFHWRETPHQSDLFQINPHRKVYSYFYEDYIPPGSCTPSPAKLTSVASSTDHRFQNCSPSPARPVFSELHSVARTDQDIQGGQCFLTDHPGDL
ncbi:hypothetical protein [Pseudoxanthomonas sp. SE1]|uniref:hypothetical protein n=1 Tax=Pseudoxanthomonas sp. SE1 TaxID=1664560 RepID=UPI00240DA59F|nr:hypothetical protein [Pseudoxanthomonas sp. SE1]WFC42304.1 hypothetical protein OY559_01820 [Pseudoxanthomonas sp. SE1]